MGSLQRLHLDQVQKKEVAEEMETSDDMEEAVTSLETPEPCRDHLRCIRESGTRYKAEITKIKSWEYSFRNISREPFSLFRLNIIRVTFDWKLFKVLLSIPVNFGES